MSRLPWSSIAIGLPVLLLGAALSALTPQFLTVENLQVLAYGLATLAVIGFAQMVVLGSGGMDLSIGAISGLVAVVVGSLMESYRVGTLTAVLLGLAVGCACGVINGWLVVRTGLSAFVVTLATGSIFAGVALGLTSAQPYYNLPSEFRAFGGASIAGVPLLILPTFLVAIALAQFFRQVGFGRQILAVGANERAAGLAGVSVAGTRVLSHTLAGFLAAIASVLLTARLGTAQPGAGIEWLLPSFAAPIIGGTLLAGGHVSVLGALAGAALLTVVTNALVQLNVDIYWTQFFSGLVIIAAGAIDRLRSSRRFPALRAGRRRTEGDVPNQPADFPARER